MQTTYWLLAVVVVSGLAACTSTPHHAHHAHDHHNHHDHHHAHDDHAHHHASNYTAWQNYQCANRQTLRVRYDNHMAEVAMGAQQNILKHDAQQDLADRTVFTNGQWKWVVNHQHGYTNTQNEANGFLTRHEQQVVNGETLSVDNILAKNCQPH